MPDVSDSARAGDQSSFFVPLLPYLERADLFQTSREPSTYFRYKVKSGAASTTVALFLCPSDPVPDDGTAGNNYRACVGPGPYGMKSPLSPGGGVGPFSALQSHPAGAFRDGLSNTIAMSEKLRGGGNPQPSYAG